MPKLRSLLLRYGIAVAGVAAAGLARWWLDPLLGDQLPFAAFFISLLVTARYAGLRPALVAVVLGGLVGTYFFVQPRNTFGFGETRVLTVLTLYLLVGFTFCYFHGTLERASRRAEEKAAEAAESREALMASERRFRTLTDHAPVGIFLTDSQGNCLFVNRRWCELAGMNPREAEGQGWSKALHVKDRERVFAAWSAATEAGKEFQDEYRFCTPEGKVSWVRGSAASLQGDGGLVGFVGTVMDVTEQANARTDLQESELRFRQLADNVREVFWMSDLTKNEILYVSPAYEEVWGRSCRSLYENPRSFFDAIHVDDQMHVHQSSLAKQSRGEATEVEYRVIRPDGSVRWVRDRSFPVRDENGEAYRMVGVVEDVTERRRAEQALRESEGRFRALMEQAPFSIQMFSPDGRTLRANRAWESLWGVPFEAITGYNILEDRQLAAKGILELVRRGFEGWSERLPAIEYNPNETIPGVAHDPDPRRWLSAVIYPIKDEQGQVREVVLIHEDVTARRRAEAALRESEERFRAAVDQAAVGVVLVGADERTLFVNRGLCSMLGYTEAELLDMSFVDVTHPDDLAAEIDLLPKLMSGEVSSSRFEKRYVRKDGSVVWGDLSVSVVRNEDGSLKYAVGVVVDVTARKRAEATSRFLADASASLAALVDYQSTLQKIATLAVPSFADWCCVDMLDETGDLKRLAVAHVDSEKVKLAHDLQRRHPPEREASRGVWKVIRSGEPELASEVTDDLLRATTKDSERLWKLRELGLASYIGVPLTMRGKVLGVLSFFTAESGRRYSTDDLAVAEDLARRASVAVENARLYHEVRAADRRKDEFLAVLAHELRNPLAPIRNSLEIMKLAGPAAGPAGHAREIAERQVQQLTRLVDDLLEVSRIVQGKLELRRERLELALVLARAVETVKPLIDADSHQLVVALPDQPVFIDADLTRLAQVLSNLLSNSARYTERGGRIQLEAGVEGGKAVIRVADNGIGIPAEMLPRIFDMFMQVASTESRPKIGLGIGLTLAKNLVELHGGSIEARSGGPGKGSEFSVRLPLASDGRLPRGEKGESAVTPGQPLPRRKVLVVDDNVDAAESLAMLLQMQGHEVLVAYDGAKALELAQSEPLQLAFLDIGMPTMDGYELARRIRDDTKLKGVFLVALTGWGQDEDRRRAREAGFDRHLVKPPEPKALEHVLMEAVRLERS